MLDPKEAALYKLLTEMENNNCFEIKTAPDDRKRIIKEIIKVMKEGSEDSLLEKTSERWL